MNPRVKSIIEIHPFSVTLEWTNGEVTTIDFKRFLARELNKKSVFSKLFQPEIFLTVKTDGRTLYWDSLAEIINVDGSKKAGPLDFCPDVLYNFSKIVIIH